MQYCMRSLKSPLLSSILCGLKGLHTHTRTHTCAHSHTVNRISSFLAPLGLLGSVAVGLLEVETASSLYRSFPVVLRAPSCITELVRGLLKNRLLGSASGVSGSGGLEQEQRKCISYKFPSDVPAASLGQDFEKCCSRARMGSI